MAKKAAKRVAKKAAPRKPSKVSARKASAGSTRRASVVQVEPEETKKPKVPQKGFSKTELDHFRKIINEKRKEILEELESLRGRIIDATTGEYEVENSAYSLHMEQGTDTMEREKAYLFASREGKFLNYLDDALKRIEQGTYGFCNDCGTLIDKERLEAVPHAQLCVECKLKRGR